ncbi:DNA-binding protein [Cupriavidus metallidurans]|uniref:DNA-binding protein n=1 Tax=Cupriavidus metallidurans TaxID=119219 RepID=UPI003D07F2DF
MTDALFSSTHAALRFAFAYSTEQYGQTPMSKLMRGTIGSGKGLIGTDGAAQAGMIRSRIDEALSGRHVAILVARFAPPRHQCNCRSSCCSGHRTNPEWDAAIQHLTDDVASLFAGSLSHRQMRRFLIDRYFGNDKDASGKKITLEDVARKCNVHRDTAAAHNAKVTQFLRGTRGINGSLGEEDKALRQADDALRGVGLVEEAVA